MFNIDIYSPFKIAYYGKIIYKKKVFKIYVQTQNLRSVKLFLGKKKKLNANPSIFPIKFVLNYILIAQK